MSTYQDLATAAADVGAALDTLQTKRAALEAKGPAVEAVLTTEQAAIDSATAAYNAAREIARESTGWNAANAELATAQATYTTAKNNFDLVVGGLTPLE